MVSIKLPPGWVSIWICLRERSGWGWAEVLGWFLNFGHKLRKKSHSTSGFNCLHVGLSQGGCTPYLLAIWMATWWHTVGWNHMEWTWTDYPRLYCVWLYEICANPCKSHCQPWDLNPPRHGNPRPQNEMNTETRVSCVFVSGDSTVLAQSATTVQNVVTTGLRMLESTSDGFLRDKGVIEYPKQWYQDFNK